MRPPSSVLKFVSGALFAGVALGLLSRYSDAVVVKVSITLPLMAASSVDSGWIFSGSWNGGVAFWSTLVAQWAALGWLVFSACSWIARRKKTDDSSP
jgi:hypothetical protein